MLTAAVRSEDYDSFGSVTTPKLGLIYSPGADFTLKASWGRSFKAPTLFQRFSSKNAYLDAPPSRFGGTGYDDDATVLSTSGGNRNLAPERARSWTAALAFHPAAIQGLEAERSEEHTSELQSLMRTSYAVFCLTNKTKTRLATKQKDS